MNREQGISDEYLNAFVDGQLDADERSRVFDAISHDEDLNQRACEMRKLRELVRHAYDEPPPAATRHPAGRRRHSRWLQTVAAGVFLAVGAALGWFGRGHAEHQNVEAMFLDPSKAFETTSLYNMPAVDGERKVILHVSSDNPGRLQAALDTAQTLLDTYRARHQKVELEVIANAGGLDLLRAGVSPYAARIKHMQQEYANLSFLACKTAMDKLQREKGIKVKLLPQAQVAPSALDEILMRLQEGWVYIKV